MQKTFFCLMLFALCSLQTPAPAPAEPDASAVASPAREQNNARQADTQHPAALPPGEQQDAADATPPEGETQPEAAQTPPAATTGHLLPPLRQLVTSPFGHRRMPGWLSRGVLMREHAGVDIRARLGWPVTAFRPGKVIRAGENGPLGISVDIRQDNGMTARYGHLSKTLAKAGQQVEAGETVGLVGCTGRTTGAHLHFGLLDASGKAVDPMPYLHTADELLHPDPAAIPSVLEAQSCGPVLRGPDGRPTRLGNTLKNIDNYTPPPLPTWSERHREQ